MDRVFDWPHGRNPGFERGVAAAYFGEPGGVDAQEEFLGQCMAVGGFEVEGGGANFVAS
jgi:hypothetical protein